MVRRSYIFSILLLISSCEISYGIGPLSDGADFTTISIRAGKSSYSPEEQSQLMAQMRTRRQISDVSEYDGVCFVSFQSGSTVHLLEECFPYFRTDDGQFWIINGNQTSFPVRLDGDGSLILPTLTATESGYWLFDDAVTDIPTEAYRHFSAEQTSEHLSALLEYHGKLFVYVSDGSILSRDILREGFYRVPDYWFDHLVEKELMMETAIREADGDYATFAFFTDAHWGYNFKHSPALLHHITEFTPLTDVYFGGDVITDHSNNTSAPFQLGLDFHASYSFLGSHFYCVYGNHDNNSAGQPSKVELHLSEEAVGQYLQSQMTELDKKEGYNFYRDDPDSKTRFIGLDTGRYNNASFRTTAPATARFLIDALSDVPEDWHVIVVSHIWAEYKKIDGVEKNVLVAFYNSFLDILHDYNAREIGVFTYKKESVAYDFSTGLGHVECCIGGHTHLNSTLFSKDVLPVIIIGKDSMKRSYHKDAEGTVNEQCIALFVVDYNLRKIKLFHVGYGKDEEIDLPPIE